MNPVFIDTSAVLALFNPDDANHERARTAFADLTVRRAALVTSSFVLLEIYALLTRRMGLEAVRRFQSEFAPLIEVIWVDEDLHNAGLDLLVEGTGDSSLVDAVSFLILREPRFEEAFCFDRHFANRGFRLLPA